MVRRRLRQVLMVSCVAMLAAGMSQVPALAAAPQAVATGNAVHRGSPAGAGGTPGQVRLADPGTVLPAG
jgi:hypothetical protein